MTTNQRLALEQSRIREKLNGLLGKEELAEEERGELDTLTERAQEIEVEIRAAIVAEGEKEPAPADPGLAELEQRAKLGSIVEGLLGGHGTTGAEKELQQELKLDADQVPLGLLHVESRQLEHRTAGQTPAPTDTGASQQPIIPSVFPMAAASFLGVEMPRVPVGDATFTVLSTDVAPGTPAAGAEQAHSAAAFTATVLDPERIQGSFFFRREDRARLAGMEEALRMNLSDAMQDKLDSEIIGANGFLNTPANGGLTAATGDATVTADFAAYRGLVYDHRHDRRSVRVDGRQRPCPVRAANLRARREHLPLEQRRRQRPRQPDACRRWCPRERSHPGPALERQRRERPGRARREGRRSASRGRADLGGRPADR